MFSQAAHVKDHERIHTGEKPYACNYCDKKFSHSFSVKKHERTHTGEKPYACSYCDKKFNSSSHVKKHERTHSDLTIKEKLEEDLPSETIDTHLLPEAIEVKKDLPEMIDVDKVSESRAIKGIHLHSQFPHNLLKM